jgi:hypothetical protein
VHRGVNLAIGDFEGRNLTSCNAMPDSLRIALVASIPSTRQSGLQQTGSASPLSCGAGCESTQHRRTVMRASSAFRPGALMKINAPTWHTATVTCGHAWPTRRAGPTLRHGHAHWRERTQGLRLTYVRHPGCTFNI